jgi:hypothetical protein
LPNLLESLEQSLLLLNDFKELVNQTEQALIDYETLCYASELRMVKVRRRLKVSVARVNCDDCWSQTGSTISIDC